VSRLKWRANWDFGFSFSFEKDPSIFTCVSSRISEEIVVQLLSDLWQ